MLSGRVLMLLVGFVSTTGARGQLFSVVPLVVSPVFLKSQLWNVNITDAGSDALVRLEVDLKDMQSHQSVLTAVSGVFHVGRGANLVQVATAEPIVYSYNSPVVTDRTPNGPLPVGQYQVCYQLFVTSAEVPKLAAEDCEEVTVEPLSPPLLTMPEDDSVVKDPLPNFTWLPPTPLTMFNNLTYDVIISEVYDGQSLTDAIQKNLPVQQAQGLQQPFLAWPSQGPQPAEGKTYAWQVVARDHMVYAAKSELWSFRTPGQKGVTAFNSSRYILMDGRATGVGFADSSTLWLKYVSSGTVYQAPLLIKDLSGTVLLTTTCKVRQGDNYLNIPLNGNFEKKRRYVAVLTDKGGRETSVTFIIK
jgi:hypothetical protein